MPHPGRFQNNHKNGRRFSPSPIRRRSRSPDRRKSRSPYRRRSRSPFRKSAAKIDRKSPGRKGSRSPRRREPRSPVNRKSLRSPKRRVSRSPVRQTRSPRRRLSRSPIKDKNILSPSPRRRASRSPGRKLSSPNRRLSSPGRNRNTSGKQQRSRSRSRSRKREDRFYHSPDLPGDRFSRFEPEDSRKLRRSPSNSPRRSPRRSPNYSNRNITDRLAPISPSPGPKIIRDTSGLSKIEPLILRKRTLDERFRTLDDGHFRIDENITIGIQRNPYAPASTSVTVQKVFDPHLFHMIHNRGSGLLPIFDRPELKYFRFDDMPHYEEEPTFERRTIKVAPSTSHSNDSRYGHLHVSRRSPSPRQRSQSPRRRSPLSRRRSPSPRRRTPSPRRLSPRNHPEIKLEMRTEPRYEKIYQDSKNDDQRFSKVISNPNDLRHNLSNRHVEDARYRIDGKREERGEKSGRSRSRERKKSRSPARNQNRKKHNNDRHGKSKEEDDLPDFSRRPDRSKYQPWVDNPSKIPKGISYFQHDNRNSFRGRRGRQGFFGQNKFAKNFPKLPDDPRDSKPPAKLLKPAKYSKINHGGKNFGTSFTNRKGRSLADRGKWKHDLFEKQLEGIDGKGDGKTSSQPSSNGHQDNTAQQ